MCNHYYYKGTAFYYISCLFVFPMKKKINRLWRLIGQLINRQICFKILRMMLSAIQHKDTNILGLKLNMFLYLYLPVYIGLFILKRFDVTSKMVSTIQAYQVASWPWVPMLQFSWHNKYLCNIKAQQAEQRPKLIAILRLYKKYWRCNYDSIAGLGFFQWNYHLLLKLTVSSYAAHYSNAMKSLQYNSKN